MAFSGIIPNLVCLDRGAFGGNVKMSKLYNFIRQPGQPLTYAATQGAHKVLRQTGRHMPTPMVSKDNVVKVRIRYARAQPEGESKRVASANGRPLMANRAVSALRRSRKPDMRWRYLK
jgi:hypothetical protein